MRCNKCGKKIKINQIDCPSCGQIIDSSDKQKEVIKTAMPILAALIIIVIFIIIINKPIEERKSTGKFEFDIVEKNKEYFDYSLGEYTYSYVEAGTECKSFIGTTYDCEEIERRYTIKYGNDEEIKIRTSNDFENSIEYMIESIIKEKFRNEIENEILENYQNNNLNEKKFSNPKITFDYKKINDSIKVTNPSKGVKINGLQLSNMKENNLKGILAFEIRYEGKILENPNFEDDMINLLSNVFNHFEEDNLEVTIKIKQYVPDEGGYPTLFFEFIKEGDSFKIIQK